LRQKTATAVVDGVAEKGHELPHAPAAKAASHFAIGPP